LVHRKGSIHCSCTNALYAAQAIQWAKCDLTCFSYKLQIWRFSWMRPWATEHTVAGHKQPTGL